MIDYGHDSARLIGRVCPGAMEAPAEMIYELTRMRVALSRPPRTDGAFGVREPMLIVLRSMSSRNLHRFTVQLVTARIFRFLMPSLHERNHHQA